MTKKKRNHPDVEEVLARPWCYYCERDFDDLKILINHQKAKHFKCERCGRRLNTAGGLSVHMSQVHKENLSAVDNALANRAGLDIEIFGMEGIPEDIVNQHTQRVLQSFHQAEAERRAASGNQGPGVAGAGPTKKPKFESPADLKKRLAEHKARMAADQANGGSSGGGTPVGAGQAPPVASQTQAQNSFQSSSPQQYASPQYPPSQPIYSAPVPQPTYGAPSVQQPYGAPPPQQQYHVQPPSIPYNQPPQYPHAPAPAPAPYQQQPMPYPQQAFSPPPYQSQSPYPPQQYSSAQQPFSPMTQGGPPQYGGPPRSFGAGSPVNQFQQQNQVPPRIHTPPQNGNLQRSASGSLPPATGLPQRPAFQAPPVNAFQFQQMHQGQLHASQNGPPGQQSFAQQNTHQNGQHQHSHVAQQPITQQQEAANSSSLDDLISEVKQAETNTQKQPVQNTVAPKAPLEPMTAPVKEDAPKEDKDGKKDKSKVAKLVYSDNEISPEEKMAMMSRYAYIPDKHAIRV